MMSHSFKILCVGLTLLLVGCSDGAETGAFSGIAAGGLIGGLATGNATGALGGAVIGGAAGAIIGDQVDHHNNDSDMYPGRRFHFDSVYLDPENQDRIAQARRSALNTLRDGESMSFVFESHDGLPLRNYKITIDGTRFHRAGLEKCRRFTEDFVVFREHRVSSAKACRYDGARWSLE